MYGLAINVEKLEARRQSLVREFAASLAGGGSQFVAADTKGRDRREEQHWESFWRGYSMGRSPILTPEERIEQEAARIAFSSGFRWGFHYGRGR